MNYTSIRIGDRLWCISASVESQSYGDDSVRKPWRGQITSITGSSFTICRISEGGIPNEDTNASAYVTSGELYKSEQEARMAYLSQRGRELYEMISAGRKGLDELKEYAAKCGVDWKELAERSKYDYVDNGCPSDRVSFSEWVNGGKGSR